MLVSSDHLRNSGTREEKQRPALHTMGSSDRTYNTEFIYLYLMFMGMKHDHGCFSCLPLEAFSTPGAYCFIYVDQQVIFIFIWGGGGGGGVVLGI